jgi:hypothetical protein
MDKTALLRGQTHFSFFSWPYATVDQRLPTNQSDIKKGLRFNVTLDFMSEAKRDRTADLNTASVWNTTAPLRCNSEL